MMSRSKPQFRVAALILAVMMVISLLPMSVFAASFDKASTITGGNTYVIVADGYAMTTEDHSGYTNTNNYAYSGFVGAAVTISGNAITAGVTEDMYWKLTASGSGYTVQHVASGKYLKSTYESNSIGGKTGTLFLTDTAEDTWSIDGSGKFVSAASSKQLTYDNNPDTISSGTGNLFGIRSTGDAISFYEVSDGASGGETPAPSGDYRQIAATDIAVGVEFMVVGKSGSSYYALTNGSEQKTAVNVSGTTLSLPSGTSDETLMWTTVEATGSQIDSSNGNDLDFAFVNGSTYFGRISNQNTVELNTSANTKYFGHDVVNGTIGNYSGGGDYYGLLYRDNKFIYVQNANNTTDGSITFWVKNAGSGDEGGDQGEDTPTTDNLTRVDTLVNGDYIIAVGSKAMTSTAHDGYSNSHGYSYKGLAPANITVSGNRITAGATDDMVFTVTISSGAVTLQHKESGKYLGATYTSNNTGYDGRLFLSDTAGSAETWEWEASNRYLRNPSASENDRDVGLYLAFDESPDDLQSGSANLFGIRSDNNMNNVDALDFYAVGDGEGGEDPAPEEPAPEDPEYVPETDPSGAVYLAFTSDVHSKTTSTTASGHSPARLNSWLNGVSETLGGYDFIDMVFCGDNADGTGAANGDDFWAKVQAVMDVAKANNNLLTDGLFLAGNHEWENGQLATTTNATAQKIQDCGTVVTEDDYVLYLFGATSSNYNQTGFQSADITALDTYLETAPTDRPIFITSHFPLHVYSGRDTANSAQVISVLNEHADDHDLYFIWGHNHSQSDPNYDQFITDQLRSTDIDFVYCAAGCMSDSEYQGSGSVDGKGLVAKIQDGEVLSLSYYGVDYEVIENGTYVPEQEEPTPEPIDPFTLAGANLKLGDALDMFFYINKSDVTGSDWYAEIVRTYADDTADETVTVPFADWESYSDTLYRVSYSGLAAKEMADELTVTIYNGDDEAVSEAWEDSIQAYVLRNFDKQNDEYKTLMVDMLNYGAAAQTFFGYNESDLANAPLTEAQKAYATASVTGTDASVRTDANFVGSSLTLESSILLTLYFKNVTSDMYAIVSYTDHYGNAHSNIRINASDFVANGSNSGVRIEGLAVADGATLVTCTIYNADGTQFAQAKDSVESYIARMSNLDAMFNEILKFTKSAYASFH